MRSSITGEKVVPVLYLDLDGTVRLGKDELGHFVNKVEDVKIFPGVTDLIRRYKEAGWRIIGVSNQGGVALGIITTDECHRMMMCTNMLIEYQFDKLMWCSHHPDAEDPEMACCWCRKPRAGLLIEGALSLANYTGEIYPPHMALMVGDRPEDKGAAEAANIRFLDAHIWRRGHHLEAYLNKEAYLSEHPKESA